MTGIADSLSPASLNIVRGINAAALVDAMSPPSVRMMDGLRLAMAQGIKVAQPDLNLTRMFDVAMRSVVGSHGIAAAVTGMPAQRMMSRMLFAQTDLLSAMHIVARDLHAPFVLQSDALSALQSATDIARSLTGLLDPEGAAGEEPASNVEEGDQPSVVAMLEAIASWLVAAKIASKRFTSRHGDGLNVLGVAVGIISLMLTVHWRHMDGLPILQGAADATLITEKLSGIHAALDDLRRAVAPTIAAEVYVTTIRVLVRQGPARNYGTVGSIPAHTMVVLVERHGKWARIRYVSAGGKERWGWTLKKHLDALADYGE